jgi:hypothetical protein
MTKKRKKYIPHQGAIEPTLPGGRLDSEGIKAIRYVQNGEKFENLKDAIRRAKDFDGWIENENEPAHTEKKVVRKKKEGD